MEEGAYAGDVCMKKYTEDHFIETGDLATKVKPSHVADWLLTYGYFPEQNILPPCFSVSDFSLKGHYNKDPKRAQRKHLVSTSYPKTELSSRTFSIQHPELYHDTVLCITENWNEIMDSVFHPGNKIYSYSFPIPISDIDADWGIPLRSGRMIYEWIEMAEKDLIADAGGYNYLIKADISNFYNSVYTHTIPWALHGREEALTDSTELLLFGSRIDKYTQSSNDQRTNGIPTGSALSDLIAEIILSRIDGEVSGRIDCEYIGTRFKDDYRFLCKTKEDARDILKILCEELEKYNLLVNEKKTEMLRLPHGLYRKHNREYQKISIKKKNRISFKLFEQTLLSTIDIHRENPSTSVLDKFLSELVDDKYNLKLATLTEKETIKVLSLLTFVEKESPKTLCHILSIIELLYLRSPKNIIMKNKIIEIIKSGINNSIEEESIFHFCWYVFFSKYMSLNIAIPDLRNCEDNFKTNEFVKSISNSRQEFFKDFKDAKFFINPKKSVSKNLAYKLDIFNKERESDVPSI